MKRLLWIGGIAVTHAMMTMTLLLTLAGRTSAAFDGHRNLNVLDRVGDVVLQLLMIPLGKLWLIMPIIWRERLPWLDNTLFYSNSVVWGIIIYMLLTKAADRRRTRAPAPVG